MTGVPHSTAENTPPVAAVLAEIQAGDRVGLSEYGRTFGCDGCTAFRHVTRGILAPTGGRVKLEAVRVGSRWITSKAAVARFVAATTAMSLPDTAAPTGAPVRSPSARRKASEDAAAELARMGC